jgi:hypothetical protein
MNGSLPLFFVHAEERGQEGILLGALHPLEEGDQLGDRDRRELGQAIEEREIG